MSRFQAASTKPSRCDVSYKGGLPGFVRIVDDATLAFPNYDGLERKPAYRDALPERDLAALAEDEG